MALIERWRGLWEDIRHTQTEQPARVAIAPDHVEWPGEPPAGGFRPNEHYFVVRVNELFLTYSREWFAKYDPMVLVVSEFTYGKEEHAVPFVVGPNLLEQHGQEAPTGMVFSDTKVAGVHPYRGGALTLSVVLSRVERENYATKFLEILESTSGVLDFATALGPYVKVASVVLDGVQALFGMEHGAEALVGHRREFDPDAGDAFGPGYFALIDAPETSVDPGSLWVRENRLYSGPSREDAKPYRDSDFVLYSIVRTERRSDESRLPFFPLLERIRSAAASTSEADRERAKGDMTSLCQTLVLSADLTAPQVRELSEAYVEELKQLLHDSRERETELATLGDNDDQVDPTTAALRASAEILKL